jgi:hypothetical protein
LLGDSTYTIRWEDSGSESCGGNYLIDYSINDGSGWIPVNSNPVSNTCAYDWLIPSIFSNQCLIRITDANDPNASDKSDDSFRIYRCMSNVLGDWDGDCYVDFGDYSIIAAGWNVHGGKDMNDLASFVQYWLDCANRHDPSCSNFGEAMPDFPADGIVIPGDEMTYHFDDFIWTKLVFIPGTTAVEHTGYFNEDYSKVESRAEDANLGPPPYASIPGWEYVFFAGHTEVPPADDSLVRGQKYYWTVDATDALGNTFAGDIWEFTIQDFKAMLPNPPNEATLVETDVLLSWLPGYNSGSYFSTQHDIYMGTSWEDVNNAVYFNPPPEFVATVEEPNILVTGLLDNTKYYWRVDQVNNRGGPIPMPEYYTGDVWCFTTISRAAEPDFPADGAVIPGNEMTYLGDDYIWTKLIFIPSATAVEHTGYFNEDYSKVESRDPCAFLGLPPYRTMPGWEYTLFAGNPQVTPDCQSLVRGTRYYWTVDAEDALGNTVAGDIWEFSIHGFKAFAPSPPNEATFVSTDVLLSWSPGFGVVGHDIYMGTSWEDVNNAEYNADNPPPEFVAIRPEPNYPISGLSNSTKLYWRVDQVNGRMPPPIGGGTYYKGDVWCFTTIAEGVGSIRMDLWWIFPPPIIALPIIIPSPPNEPDETRILTSFDSGTELAENYKGMIHGWLHPQSSGNYTFWLATDDVGELYLSTDENPANMSLIAYIRNWTSPYEWYDNGEPYQQSAPIPLVGGRKYYIRATWIEGGGGDHCMVAWQGPDQPLAPVQGSASAVIPGSRLSPFE